MLSRYQKLKYEKYCLNLVDIDTEIIRILSHSSILWDWHFIYYCFKNVGLIYIGSWYQPIALLFKKEAAWYIEIGINI